MIHKRAEIKYPLKEAHWADLDVCPKCGRKIGTCTLAGRGYVCTVCFGNKSAHEVDNEC